MMNGIEKITGKITSDAQKEIRDILDKAAAEVAQVKEQYLGDAQALKEKLLQEGEEQAKEQVRRAKAVAELEGRQALLSSKQKMISLAFDKALEQLLTLPEADYAALLSRLAAQASSTGQEEIVLSPKDRAALGQKVVDGANEILKAQSRPATLVLSEETRPLVGGVQLKAGDVEVNSTLDSIVHFSKDALALDVATVLFA